MHASALLIILSLASLLAPLPAQGQQQIVLHKLVFSDSRCSFATESLYNGLKPGQRQQNSFYYLGNSSCSYTTDGYDSESYVNATLIDGTVFKYFTPVRSAPLGVVLPEYPPASLVCDVYNREKDNNSIGWSWSLEEKSENIDSTRCLAHSGVDTAFYTYALGRMDADISIPIAEFDARTAFGTTANSGAGRRSVADGTVQTYTPLTPRNDLTEEFVKSELAHLRGALEGQEKDATGENNVLAIVAIILASISIVINVAMLIRLCVMGCRGVEQVQTATLKAPYQQPWKMLRVEGLGGQPFRRI